MDANPPLRTLLASVFLTANRSSKSSNSITNHIRKSSFPVIQTRGHQTQRRTRKALNIPPAPSFGGPPPVATGGSGRSHRPRHDSLQRGDSIVFNPPSSAPNVYHTPSIFLPRDDPRKNLILRTAANSGPARYSSVTTTTPTTGAEGPLPRALRDFTLKKYHLGPKEIEEMRRLRTEDSATWTRAKLAEKFQCSAMFVGTVVRASQEWRQTVRQREEERKKLWGPKRRKARVDRVKRKELWMRGE